MNPLKQKIIETFKGNFPTKEQIINQGEGSWDFTDYFDKKLAGLIGQIEKSQNQNLLKEIEKELEPHIMNPNRKGEELMYEVKNTIAEEIWIKQLEKLKTLITK
jgi:hypothetical protein